MSQDHLSVPLLEIMHSDQTADAATFGLKHIYVINAVITALVRIVFVLTRVHVHLLPLCLIIAYRKSSDASFPMISQHLAV